MSALHRRGDFSVSGQVQQADVRLEAGRLRGTLTKPDGAALPVDVGVTRLSDGTLRLDCGGRPVRATVLSRAGGTLVAIGGRTFEVRPVDGAVRASARAGAALHHEPFATSPMTGRLAQVAVLAGQAVQAGAPLFVVEAMKMEYVVKAPRALVVSQVRRQAGDKVSLGEVVVAFEPEA